MKRKRFQIFSISLSFFGIIATSIALVSCSTKAFDVKYSFITLDSVLSGNLATLGYKPTLQSLYNEATTIPKYIQDLNVETETNKQPQTSNAEMWLERSSKIVYGYTYQMPSDLNLYGIRSCIGDLDKYSTNTAVGLDGYVDESAAYQHKDKTWSWSDKLSFLATELNSRIENKDGSKLFENVDNFIKEVEARYNNKILKFKDALSSNNQNDKTISFWASNYGPNYVSDLTKYNEYGPSINYPGWLFDPSNSLEFKVAVPTTNPTIKQEKLDGENSFKLSVFNHDGFNSIGWKPTTGNYSATAVQEAFTNSSDYVVVIIDSSSINIQEQESIIKENFRKMLKSDTTNIPNADDQDKNIIILDAASFTLTPYDILGMENTIDLLAEKILDENKAIEVKNEKIFDLTNLITLSTINFNIL